MEPKLTEKINSYLNFDYSTKKRDIKLKNPNLELNQRGNIDDLIQTVLNNDYNEYTLPDLKKMKTESPNPEYKEIMEHDYAIKPLPKQDDYAKLKKAYEYLLSRYSENLISLDKLTDKYQLLFAKYKTDTEAITVLQGSNLSMVQELCKDSVSDDRKREVSLVLDGLKDKYDKYNTNLIKLFKDDTKPNEYKRIQYLMQFLVKFRDS